MARSIGRLLGTFILLFLIMTGGLVYWQVVKADNVRSAEHNVRDFVGENCPRRGRIFDRNGILLAESLKDPLAPCGYIRHYTEPSLSNLIGYYVAGYPPYGVEAAFNDILSGQVGITAMDQFVRHTLHEPSVGNDIYLTIDVRIQRVINRDFDTFNPPDNKLVYASNRGAIVVSNPHTGEILAMLSRPSYDANKMVQTLSAGGKHREDYFKQVNKENALINRPLQARYIPGSIFKTVTLMGALDSGTYTLDSQWNMQQSLGPIIYDSSLIGPDKNLGYPFFTPKFPITTQYAYSNSDNVVFAQIGVKMGAQKWLDYTRRLYINQDIPFDLPVVQSSVLNPDGHPLSTWQLAEDAFGQGVDFVTPLQMSLVDNAVANDGMLMKPSLLTRVVDQDEQPVAITEPQQLNQVISSQTASEVRQSMFAVTRCNGGYPSIPIHTSPWGIMGKTGTAELGTGQPPHSWMLTQAPYYSSDPTQQPAITVVAMKENGGEAINAIGPIIAHIYQDIFSQQLVKVEAPNNPDSDIYCPAHHLWKQ
ncbi:penicillin-binding transpeptidase domain-containing protein [Dictyobacter aurantiacus]|uniref:Peptidoglycan glycosyltransferase n=1 Tax=Dictyobacter aurantiacus TaxID=1936993 RepID=A0A401Z846_9CHLR|nr:penicillin-binding transpeptidase domain-containing protein [Dictyobacter aurantiacus]GCE02988.1 peptidoglycan glycosyltransferase [Dictyobacter aurantiacus]